MFFGVFYPLTMEFIQDYSIKSLYKSNKLSQNAKVLYEFYNDYLIHKTENGETKISYDMLNDIIETKTNVYLMLSKNQGLILSKDEMDEDLMAFIEKLKEEKGFNKKGLKMFA